MSPLSVVRVSRRRRALLAPALAVLLAAVLPAAAYGQATRTWVSGTGDDFNPCSRTAPCKTFAGAISKTAAGGEIDALDPGGYGAVQINKSLTISGAGTQASILTGGSYGITISAGPQDTVVLDNLHINGIGKTSAPGTVGVRITQAGEVHIKDSHIFGFSGAGVDFEPGCSALSTGKLTIDNTTIEDNGGSGVQAGLAGSCPSGRITLTRDQVDGNGCGISAGGACGATSGSGVPVMIASSNSSIVDNTQSGVLSVGGTAANIISKDLITGNGIGLNVVGGVIFSFGDNQVFGNGTDGMPNGSISNRARRLQPSQIWRQLVARSHALKKAHRRLRH